MKKLKMKKLKMKKKKLKKNKNEKNKIKEKDDDKLIIIKPLNSLAILIINL